MGSVKDIQVIIPPTAEKMGKGIFDFSNRYSVFDWGEMPDHIPHKGEAVCMIGAYFFERLAQTDILTHYVSLRKKGRMESPLLKAEQSIPAGSMEVDLVPVMHPTFVNGRYQYPKQSRADMRLVPLELIYRNRLPAGSSVFSRLASGELSLEDLGLTSPPFPGDVLSKPMHDVSTKLERRDRYLSWEEAKRIACLDDDNIKELHTLLDAVNALITREYARSNVVNEDGKIEAAVGYFGLDFCPRLMVVDVLGTPDECRLTFKGIPFSKELAREYYRKTSWYDAVRDAKERAEREGIVDWKSLCKKQPEHLPEHLVTLISHMYTSLANALYEKRLFNAPSLDEVAAEYYALQKK